MTLVVAVNPLTFFLKVDDLVTINSIIPTYDTLVITLARAKKRNKSKQQFDLDD